MIRYDRCNADECFLAGTAAEFIPVVKLDGREIGDAKPGPITQRVREAFRRRVLVKGTRL
jgi:branched-chain amino acid aminotransferase